MNQVELSKNALAKLAELWEQISVLEECCKGINNNITADKFLDKKLVLKTQSALVNFISIDGDLRDIYEKLPLGMLPDKVSKAYGVVRDYHEEVSVKEKYRKAISFLNSLHCGDAAIESIINAELDEVSGLNISAASEKELQKYNKYVDLYCFYNGEESLLANVAMEFPYELIIRIIRDKSDFVVNKDECVTELQEAVDGPVIAEPEVVAVTEVKAIETEVVTEEEPPKEVEEAFVAEQEVVVNSEVKAIETEVVTEEEPSKKEELVAEQEVAETEENNLPEITVEIPELAFWRQPIPIQVFRSEAKENKNNTASTIKKELGKLNCRGCQIDVIIDFMGAIYSDEYWGLVAGKDRFDKNTCKRLKDYKYSLEQFYANGYLVKYTSDLYGTFYSITDKGLKIFDLKKAIPFKKSRKDYLKKIYDHAINSGDGAKIVYIGVLSKMFYNMHVCNIPTYSILTTDLLESYLIFINRMTISSGKKLSTFIVGLIGTEVDDFRRVLDGMNKRCDDIDNAEAIITIGFTKEHAKSVLEWLTASMPEKFASKDKYYYIIDEMKLYSLEDDRPVDDFDKVYEIFEAKKIAAEQAETNSQAEPKDEVLDNKIAEVIALDTVPEFCELETAEGVLIEKHEADKKVTAELGSELEMKTSLEPIVDEQTKAKEITEQQSQSETLIPDANIAAEAQNDDKEENNTFVVVKVEESDAEAVSVKQDVSVVDNEDYYQSYRSILATSKMYCATAYMRKLYEIDSKYENEYLHLAYAVNDPLASCDYNSDKIINVYFNSDETNGYLLASAMLRNFYSNQYGYDYKMESLMDSVRELEPFASDKYLRQLLEVFKNFKDKNHFGMTKLSDYSIRNTDMLRQKLGSLSKQAEDQLTFSMEVSRKTGISNRRLYETRKLLFDQGSDLCEYLSLAIKRDTNDTSLGLLRDYLVNTYIKDGTEISDENIDANKINVVVNDAWEKAGHIINNKKNVQLVSGARTTVIHKIGDIVKVLCQFLNTADAIVEDSLKDYLPAYKKSQKDALEKIEKLILNYTNKDKNQENVCYEKNVLIYTLKELKDSLNGKERGFTGKYLYLPFLALDHVILDNNCLPLLGDIKELPSMDVLKRIEKHAKSDYAPILERLNGILHNDKDIWIALSNEDNYGSIELMLRYLEENNPGFADKCRSENRIGDAIAFGKEEIRRRLNEFKNDLELRQIYGQLDDAEENKKERILDTVDILYEKATESHNFGFFKKVLKSFAEQIEADAKSQGKRIDENLKAFLDSYKAEDDVYSEVIEKMVKRVREYIKLQKYASAEDLINRLENKDYDLENEPKERDYLREFLSQYDSIQRRISDNSKSLVIQVPINRKVSKEQRSAQKLINAWPKSDSGREVNETKLRELLSLLGFSVGEIERDKIIAGKFTNFNVMLEKAQDGRRNNYRHPIAAFGSIAESFSFKVVYIFGKYDADQLSAVCNDIGDARHNIVLLDYALKENERRKLARLIKNKASNKIFVVIDRVVLTYIADNYSEQTVLARLMQIIMPYSYYQPYVADPKQTMPPEIFIGRKDELDDIKSADGVNIVYGGRQLGKSALLKKAYKDIDRNESGDRAIYIDIKGMDYKKAASKICQELIMAKILDKGCKCDDWNELAMHIKERLLVEGSTKISYFLLLLDEADAFLESCKSIDYRPFDALKDIQSVGYGRFKFVIAGLRNVIRFSKVALENNSVLPQLKSTTVKPFKAVEARRLIEYPLSYLGFRFEDNMETDALVSTILSQTNCFPGLLQLYCSRLIEAMGQGYAGYNESETPPYIVSESHIKKVLGEQNLQNEIKEKFLITLYVGDDKYYYLIALIVAFLHDDESVDGITPGRILKFAEEYGIGVLKNLKEENIEALMEEMRELNVLQHEGNHGYRFTRLNFPRMMGDKEKIEESLLEFMEEA